MWPDIFKNSFCLIASTNSNLSLAYKYIFCILLFFGKFSILAKFFAKIENLPKNNKMQKMYLYANERLLLVLAIKQKRILKNIRQH